VNGSGTPTSSGLLSGGSALMGSGLPGDRGSSADSGVRGSSDRESGATSAGGGNLSDSTTDGKYQVYTCTLYIVSLLVTHWSLALTGTPTITVEGSGNIDMDSISVVSSIIGQHTYQCKYSLSFIIIFIFIYNM
jgi:hypothetical protein